MADNQRHFEHELVASGDISQGETVQFYSSPYTVGEILYVTRYPRSFLEERSAFIGEAALDLVKGQKCHATFDNGCKVWPVVPIEEVSNRIAIKFSPRG